MTTLRTGREDSKELVLVFGLHGIPNDPINRTAEPVPHNWASAQALGCGLRFALNSSAMVILRRLPTTAHAFSLDDLQPSHFCFLDRPDLL